ncbi:LysR family transcriptional regulator [Rhizobium sp. ICMP 5592]|uniref:LysR family transcriptional regulator n=1 Tax=Rhizobium sp. ICMP 5592 TaxID=2292445 RepID=UPI0012980676|nr:LysR family transcriptional regulator [Rhizobium sp. ICMP 5592]MQB46025.1 LysR family transcriptional regulator [Rhizobium sp. ICMP 5592]
MSRLPVPLSSLEIFAEAGKTGSFTRAAENLALSTSAISQAVRKLEGRLGCELFIRVGNALNITPEGELLLAHVNAGISQMRAGLGALLTNKEEPISISSPPGIASQLLPTVVQKLIALNAKDIRLVSDETPDFISYHAFDVAILYGEAAARLHDLEPLGPDVFTPVCSPQLRRQISVIDDIARLPLIVNETNAVTWSDWLRRNGLSPTSINWLRFNRASQIIPAVMGGFGVALESLRVFAPQIERGELVPCDFPGSISISRELTFLHVTKNPVRHQQAEQIAELIREECFTNFDGRRRKVAEHEIAGNL